MILEESQVLNVKMIHNTGVYRFKKGFNGDFVEFINELYMIFDPFMNTIFNVSQWMYNKLMSTKNLIKSK